jgi:hypothetical protein
MINIMLMESGIVHGSDRSYIPSGSPPPTPPPTPTAVLTGVRSTSLASNLNISTKGLLDWWKYANTLGYFETAAKNIATRLIGSAYTKPPGFDGEKNTTQSFQWTGGIPVATGTGIARGLTCQNAVNGGWTMNVNTSMSSRLFTLYFEVFSCTATFTVTMPGSGATAYADTVVASSGAFVAGNYAITFRDVIENGNLVINFNIGSVISATASTITILASTLE